MPLEPVPGPRNTKEAAPSWARTSHEEDAALVGRVLRGDAAAWNEFIERYGGLIYSIVRRYLHARDRDDIRTVFVEVLVHLRRTKLRTYEGRAALATWLTLATRSQVLDHLRKTFGRSAGARAFRALSRTEQRIFRGFYIEGRSLSELVAELGAKGEAWSADRVVATLRSIDERVGDRWLKRLSYDLHAQSTGAASGRLLEYLDHVRLEYQQRAGAHSPEYFLMEREVQRTVDRLRVFVAGLAPRDRMLLEMRFNKGWSARKIASELGLGEPRKVYGMLEHLIGGLRSRFRSGDPPS